MEEGKTYSGVSFLSCHDIGESRKYIYEASFVLLKKINQLH
jgi:hypothetical protein